VFVVEKNGGRRMGKREGSFVVINLIKGFKFVVNFVCKNNMSSYFLVFLIFFHCNSLNIYRWNIFISVY
jgi:hypothetical protein